MMLLFSIGLLLLIAYCMVKLTLSLVSVIPSVLGIVLLLWILLYWPLSYTLTVVVLILLVLRYSK